MQAVTILLIDDHALFRSGLSVVLRLAIADAVVLEAASLEEAMRGTMNAPDVLLLDIQLQGLNGLDGIALLKRKWPLVPIVMVSSDTAPETIRLTLERGVAAFVSKAETSDRMLAVINQVLRGKSALSLAETCTSPAEKSLLTPRQYEVLDLLCRGMSNKVIGRQLGLSENTVRGHVQAILVALSVTSRSEAAWAARHLGLVG